MKIYTISDNITHSESEMRAMGAYFDSKQQAWVYSEYAPGKEALAKYASRESLSREYYSLTVMSRLLGLNREKVRSFLVAQKMIEVVDGKSELTEKALKNGAKTLTATHDGTAFTYAGFNDGWAKFLTRYRDRVEATPLPEKEPKKADQTAPAKDAAPLSDAPAEQKSASDAGAWRPTITRFVKTLIPDDALILDTETTGMGAGDEVIELGIIDLDGNILYQGLFKPIAPISPGARKIHHISDEMLAAAPDYADEVEKIRAIVSGHPLVGHNVSFDRKLLTQTHNVHRGGDDIWWNAIPVYYDTMAVAKRFLKVHSFSLDALCRMLGIEEGEEKHRSVDDAKWCLWLLNTLEARPFLPLSKR